MILEFARGVGNWDSGEWARAMKGLAIADADPSRFGERVDWDDFALVMERLCEGSSDIELRLWGKQFVQKHPWVPIAATLARITPRMLLHIGFELSRSVHRNWEWEFDMFSETARMRIEIDPRTRGCRPLMVMMVGEVEELCDLFDAPFAEVTFDHGSHHCDVEISQLPVRKLDRAFKAGASLGDAVPAQCGLLRLMSKWLDSDSEAPFDLPSALSLQRRYGLTRAEARVAHRLTAGFSVGQCAEDLGVSRNTVRTHLSRVFSKTGFRSQVALVSGLLRGNESE